MASMGNDAARISESVQVAPSEISATIPRNYRLEGVVLHANPSIPIAGEIREMTGAIRDVTDFGGYGYQGYRAGNQSLELAR